MINLVKILGRTFSASVLCLGIFTLTSNASTLVLPQGLDTREGSAASGILNDAAHEQTVYAAANFPNIPITIQELHFRPNVTDYLPGAPFSGAVLYLQITLSTTTASPGGLSSTFSNNIGADAVVVVNGPVTLSSAFSGPVQGPKAFDIVIPLSQPFTYNPAAGNLLVDIQNFSGESATPIDAENASVASVASRLVSGSPTSTTGIQDGDADVLQLVYSAVTNPITVTTNGYVVALLRSECTSAPSHPPAVGQTAIGPDYVMKTVGIGDPTNFAGAQQLATDAEFESLMPLYCALPRGTGIGCVTNRVQWNVMIYDANGNPKVSGCAASGCDYHTVGPCNPVPVTNGYVTAFLRSDCTSVPPHPPAVGQTVTGPDYVIKTVGIGSPTNFAGAQQLATDAEFQSLMPLYCALPRGTGIGCVTNRVQWNVEIYDANGNPAVSGCAASGCDYHTVGPCNPVPVTNGYVTALLRSDCTSVPPHPPAVGQTVIGPDYVIKTVGIGDPTNFAGAQQLATDAEFQALMPLYCALPRGTGIGCVTNRVQWNVEIYDANGNPAVSGCAASGCDYHTVGPCNPAPVTNGYVTALLRSDCTSVPPHPPAVGQTVTGPDYVIKTVGIGSPGDFAGAQQLATDAEFQSLMSLYCALPRGTGIGCVTNRVQWNVEIYDANGNPAVSGCAASGCDYHTVGDCATPALKISSSATNVKLSWPTNTSDYVLLESSNLMDWYPSAQPLATNGGTISAQMPPAGHGIYYRLVHK